MHIHVCTYVYFIHMCAYRDIEIDIFHTEGQNMPLNSLSAIFPCRTFPNQ